MTDIYDGTECTDMDIEDLKARSRTAARREEAASSLSAYRGGPEVIGARAD
jgi:hypothetical protein